MEAESNFLVHFPAFVQQTDSSIPYQQMLSDATAQADAKHHSHRKIIIAARYQLTFDRKPLTTTIKY